MITLDSFDSGDLKIVYPLVFRFQNEDSKRMKLFIIDKIDKELIKVKESLKAELELC